MINRDEIDPQGAIERNAAAAGVAISEELSSLNPNIEMDAKEFGEHVRNGGWKLGLLVARSVAAGAGQTSGLKNVAENSATSKISSRAFARQAGGTITDKTVGKYLNAWNMAAADGLVPASSDLNPGQNYSFEDETHTDSEWKKYFSPSSGEDKNDLVSLYNKTNGSLNVDAINVENFNSQSEFTVPQGYKAAVQLERAAKEAQSRWIALARTLNIDVREGDYN